MNSLKNAEKRNIEEAFSLFIKQNKIFFKESVSYQQIGYDEYYIEAVCGNNNSYFSSHDLKSQPSKEYLWASEMVDVFDGKCFGFKNCDFSFYFKFIKDNQSILSPKETAFLLKNKLFSSPSKVMDELINLNNSNVNNSFFTHSFLAGNLDLFIENYKRFPFFHEEDKYFFSILEKSAYFKRDDFRKKVYKLVKDKFTNPDLFRNKFTSMLSSENVELFNSKRVQSFYLNVSKGDLYGFNLMRDYQTKDINFLLNLMVGKISEIGSCFGINDCISPQQHNQSPEKNIFICFFGDSDSDLKVDLLRDVFNKYVKSILSENTLEDAISQIKSGIVLEKIMLEKKLSEVILKSKKNKI